LIRDLFPHSCDVYRLQGFSDTDFSSTSEGEVTETWGIVALNVPCRFEPEDGTFQRRSDGAVDIGDHQFFVDPDVDIRNADRVYRAEGEIGADFFSVVGVTYRRDMHDKLHHKEIRCAHIDWATPSSATTPWIPEPLPATIKAYRKDFNYTTVFPLSVCDVVAGDMIKMVMVQTDIVFDDVEAYVTVGYGGVQDNLVSADQPDLGSVSLHEEINNANVLSDTTIEIYGDLKTSTQGSGIVFVEIITEQ
jgi:hypothetical protein